LRLLYGYSPCNGVKETDARATIPAGGSVDLGGMRANTRWLFDFTRGKDFIYIPLGSGAEFYALSEEECRVVIKMVVEEVNGQHPVFAGGGRAGTLEAIRL